MRISRVVVGVAALALVSTSCTRGGTLEAEATDTASWKTYPTHAALVDAAREEGSLKVVTSYEPALNEAVAKGFMAKYPFIEVQVDERENDAESKALLELQSGQSDYDLNSSSDVYYTEFLPFAEEINVLEMAKAGTLQIPEPMINPEVPSIFAAASQAVAMAWNKELLPDSEVPSSYDDFLDPKWRGKFMVNVEATGIAMLQQTWGEQKMLDYAKNLAANNPVWTDSDTAGITVMSAGEYPVYLASQYHSAYRIQQRLQNEGIDKVGIKLLDPVPVQIRSFMFVQKGSEHPAAALLFLEYLAGEEAQGYLDELGPALGSIYSEGSQLNELIKGHEVALNGWEFTPVLPEQAKKVQSTWGFPTGVVNR